MLPKPPNLQNDPGEVNILTPILQEKRKQAQRKQLAQGSIREEVRFGVPIQIPPHWAASNLGAQFHVAVDIH